MRRATPLETGHLLWLDTARGLAMLWIFLVHFVERFLCCPAFANPSGTWPDLAGRIDQIMPLDGGGFEGLFANSLRYVGWLGDQGVQLFLVASGFGLTLAALRRPQPLRAVPFIRRRLARILPQYWFVHVVFVVTFVVAGRGLNPFDWRTAASFLGLRFLPGAMYYFAAAWWFIGLVLQFYVVFPWLFRIVAGPHGIRNSLFLIAAGIVVRTVGLVLIDLYQPSLLDWWSRGAIFLSRLPDFAAGMLFALLMWRRGDVLTRITTGPAAVLGWILVWMVGNVASFFLVGMGVAFFLTAVSLFALVYMAAHARTGRTGAPVKWLGRNSYSFFLVHHPVIVLVVPATLSPFAPGRVTILLVLSLAIALLLGLALERATDWSVRTANRWYIEGGVWRPLVRIALAGVLLIVAIVGVELFVRAIAPQEVMGWGERSALVPSDTVGYTLRPGSETRLRWLGYDYVVTANDLGFPGSLYPVAKPVGTTRVLVTGDAFESAEGVDTDLAWPRLLEEELGARGLDAQVMNFSVTGWGPRHFDLAVAEYAPRYRPDVIIIGFFVNEFFDVLLSDEDYYRSIGFERRSQTGLYSLVRMSHTRSLVRYATRDWLPAILAGRPNGRATMFGNLGAFEIANRPIMEANARSVEEHLTSMRSVAEAVEARMVVLLVPASVQVCDPDDLHYMTRGVDIAHSEMYDLEQPQEIAAAMMKRLDLPYLDLRAELAGPECHYSPRNMHWTPEGHRLVAAVVADALVEDEWRR